MPLRCDWNNDDDDDDDDDDDEEYVTHFITYFILTANIPPENSMAN